MREIVAGCLLAASGLPRLPETSTPDRSTWPTSFRDPADGSTPAPRPLLPYLQWLAESRRVVFHGSPTGGLTELSDVRQSRDRSAYGDQAAVFASQDPVWAMFFAVLRRDGLHSMRNATLGRDPGLRGRRYLFSVRGTEPLLGTGAVYVLPAAGFEHEPRQAGLFDTAHRTHLGPVRPLAWFEVRPADFPFAAYLITHSDDEPVARTFWNARRRVSGARP